MNLRSRQFGVHFTPMRPWFPFVNRKSLAADLIASLTNTVVVLPQGIAFALIAGLPPEYGLFTAMVASAVSRFRGASMVMVSGPTTAISAMLFATLSLRAAPGTETYIALAIPLTLLVGLLRLATGLMRLGGLISFISHSVLTGFTAAAAFLIAASQLSGVLGVETEPGGRCCGACNGRIMGRVPRNQPDSRLDCRDNARDAVDFEPHPQADTILYHCACRRFRRWHCARCGTKRHLDVHLAVVGCPVIFPADIRLCGDIGSLSLRLMFAMCRCPPWPRSSFMWPTGLSISRKSDT